MRQEFSAFDVLSAMELTGRRRMYSEAKIEAARKILESRELPPRAAAPWLHRLLWKAGVDMPSPYFASYAQNFIFAWIFFALGMSIAMAFLFNEKPFYKIVIACLVGGLAMGFVMARQWRNIQEQNDLPKWNEIEQVGSAEPAKPNLK